MADELPSQFLEDCNNKLEAASSLSISLNRSRNTNTSPSFGSSDASWSVLSSPVESEQSSTTEIESQESEEEDDDYMAELSRRMALHMLQEDDHNNKKVTHYSPWRSSSSSSSANSSPLSIFWPPLGSNSTTQESPKFQSKQAFVGDQIRSIKYYKLNLKHHQPLNQQYQSKRRANVTDPQSSNSKTKSCGGTGVFLPKGIGRASSDTPKKQGCSTVLIPANVVQALKKHFDKVGVTSRLVNGNFPLQNGGMKGLKNNGSSFNSQQQWLAPAPKYPELALPQEWTY